jgi:hypothetical protein
MHSDSWDQGVFVGLRPKTQTLDSEDLANVATVCKSCRKQV